MKKKFLVRKIPVDMLLDCLNDLNRSGVEFIDIVGKKCTDNLDMIGIIVREEYADAPDSRIGVSFDEKDINDLIA